MSCAVSRGSVVKSRLFPGVGFFRFLICARKLRDTLTLRSCTQTWNANARYLSVMSNRLNNFTNNRTLAPNLHWMALILAFCSFSTGCAGVKAPDLKRLYAHSGHVSEQPPVILIHGVMGSKLRDRNSGREIWPGAMTRLMQSDFQDLALDIDPDTLRPLPSRLEAFDLTSSIGQRDFYAAITHTLEDAGGYTRTTPGIPVDAGVRRYYVFTYDWRYDNVDTAQQLSRLIEQIRTDFGDPDLKVDLIAHSMGSLIARYYLRYGEQDVLDGNEFSANMHGRSRLRRMVLLGPPNLGSVEAIKSFISGRKVGFTRIPTEVLVTMPSVYQLFPHAINDWLVTTDGTPLDRDQYDIEVWRRFHWSIFDPDVRRRISRTSATPELGEKRLRLLERYFEKSLERARRFSWSLTVPVDNPLPLIVFGGDCEMTPARLVVEEIEGESVLRLWPNEIAHPLSGIDYIDLMLEPGDGMVTKASLLGRPVLDTTVPRHKYSFLPLDYSFFLCEQHDTLASNVSFLDNLLHALLNRDPSF